MKSYHITELEQLTGIKAHTLRIWEKRYRILKPHRTLTNIRYYDDTQLRKLLNICMLLSNGYKISKVAALNENKIHQLIKQLEDIPTASEIIINKMIIAILAFDELQFEKLFSTSVKQWGVFDTMITIIYPLLKRIGLMWSINDASPIEEHFITAIIQRKLCTAIDTLPPAHKKNKKYILFLPPDECHEIGLLFANYILRSKGLSTIYLGQNVPYTNLQEYISKINPSHLVVFFTTKRNDEETIKDLKKIITKHPKKKVLVAGYQTLLEKIRAIKGIKLLQAPHDLLKSIV